VKVSPVKSKDDRIGQTFGALADPTRRAILRRLERSRDLTIGELAEPLPMQLPAVLKHLGILQQVGLIRRRKAGRSVYVSLRPAPIREALDWLARYEHFWSPRLDRLTALAEARERTMRSSK
jgi:DNA-binding transcriptional ArsR family regulator